MMAELLQIQTHPYLLATGILLTAACLGWLIHATIFHGMSTIGARFPEVLVFDGCLLHRSRAPMRLLLPLLAVRWALPWVRGLIGERPLEITLDLVYVSLVATLAWFFTALTGVLEDLIESRFELSIADNLRARRIRTQTALLRRVLIVLVGTISLAMILLRFEGLRTLGTGLLAWAGILGAVIGIAAQRPLGNLLAGIQIAVTQPVRVDDVVVVEGEWGRIEEVNLTYIVVRIWDDRRLVLPINYFVEKPFQNWTRSSAQIIGTVSLHVDYSTPVEIVRDEARRIVESSRYWDRRAFALQVVNATERTMELRVLVSASNAGEAWELRCEVREKLIAYLQSHHSESLPRVRALLHPQEQGSSDSGPAWRVHDG